MDQEKEERYAGAEQGRGAVYDNYGYQAELASRLHPGWPNGQKQVYVSQSTLYDSWSNMPGEEEGSTVNCKRCLLVLGIILLISGIIAGIVLAIYFSQRDTYVEPKSSPTGNTLPPTIGTTAAPSVRKKFAVNMTTAGTFDPELNDPNSQKYKDKAKEYENKMDDVYKNSSLSDKYKGTEVKGFSKGSIIVQAEISFDVPTVVNSSGSVTIPADVNATTVKALILQSADDLNLEKNNTDLVTATEIIEKETTAAPIVTTQQPATPKVTEMVTTSKPDIPITEPNTPEQPITTAPSESVTESNIVTTTAQQTSNALDITDEPATEYKETTMTPFMTTLSNVNISDDGSCNPGLASCRNSQCIRRDWFCDKHIDCLDGSDENDAQCGRNTTTPPTPMPKLNGKDLDCNFDSHAKELCNYKASPGGYNWSVIQGPTSSNKTGPDYDHTTFNPKGRFLFTESSYGSPNDNATMTSVIVTTDGSSRSLTFYYHMYGAHMGVLEVYFNIVKQKDFERVLKWKESGNHGNIWLKACIAMPKNTKLSVEFIAYRGLNYTSDIAIDDIKYSTDKCESVSCTFEDSDCGYPMLSNDNNDGSWRRVRGENMVDKPSAPATDFTLGTQYGAYMVADSSNNKGINPVFGTTLINVSQITTLNFRLYISGTGSASMKLNLQTRSGFNLTFTKYSNPKVWTRACVPVPEDFYGTADFQAGRTSGAPRYVAVDDIALGPESSCEGFTGCRFENGLFCNFDVTGTTYRWRRFSGLKDDYVVANGEGLEGTITSLVTPKFVPTANSSLNFRYAIKGTSILSVWVRQFNEGGQSKKKIWTTEGMMNGVQTTPIKAEHINSRTQKDINDNNNMDWLTGCFDIPLGNITIEIVSRKIDRNGGEVALNWVEVVNKPCKIGLDYTPCNFDDPNICGYVIDCPFNTQYKWKRISGSTPTLSTGPLRDHSYNSTIGNYLYTEGTDGRAGDKAIVTFMNVETARNTSLRFYYYMSGRDIGSLYITIGKTSGEISWIQAGGKSPSWYFGCVDLPSNQNTNISFTGVRGDGPVSDIAIDDVHLLDGKCPDRSIACDFENEMMCGYTGLSIRDLRVDKSFNEQWVRRNGSSSILPQRDHTLNSSNGNFLFTENPSKIISPRIPYGQTMCLQFYYYIQLGKGQDIKVITDYVDKAKNKEKVIGIYGYSLAQWRHAQMTLEPGNVSVIFSVERYKQEISSTFFAIDDVSMDFKKCPDTVCADKMYKCKKDDFCIPEYKKCDWIQDCSDGADEQNCPADMATIRLINGVTSGDQGRLEIYVNGSWGTAYSLRWFENNAKVACRELGYTGFYKTIRFGKFFFGLGDVWQINCDGNETSIQDCDKVNVSSTIPHLYDVGLACYNTVCEPGKRDCPKVANSTVVYCLHQNQFCDGDFDCPGGEDENNCSNCRNNEFSCKNHQCIPESSRCDGKADCKDASDEMDCVRRDVEGNVEVFHNDSWMPLCYGTNNAFHSSLCLIMGQGVAKRKIMVNSTALGLVPHPSHTMTAVGKYKLSVSSKACPKMKLECYGQECGRRSKKVVASFVQFGSQAIPAEYPWQVMLLRNGKFHCGASIFNSRWLITAEHCVVERYVKYEVVAGLLRMQDLSKFPKLQIIQIVHSMNYGNNKGIPINDIALILLEKDLVFTEYIQPVCLPSKKYTSEDYCYLSGWGRDENLVGQSHLKETKVYANTSEECKKYYDNITDNSFLCFSHKQPNMPSCYGDSGGPLVCRNDRGRFELVGVVSFGLPLCAAANGTPAAFTNVLNFRGWIVDQTRCKMWCPDGKCLYEAETCDGIDHCRDRSDETAPKCSPTVACNFGKGYKCGYRNDSATPWYWSSPHWSTPNMKSKPMIGGDTETDEYMLASVKATKSSPARLISPSTTEIPCVSFKYLANANNSAKTVLILKAFEQNTTYKTVWDNDKNSTQEQLFWKLATVSLPNKTTHLMFEAYYENPDEYSFIAIDSVKVMDNNCTVCSATEFQCNSGHCINATQVCDGIQQCNDASDEMNCFKPTEPVGCNIDHFQCSNGQCVLKDKKCNGLKDCRDGSDEINCTRPTACQAQEYRCNNGECILKSKRCDRMIDCSDESDELDCGYHTTPTPTPGFSGCRFENGLFCNFVVNGTNYKWKSVNQMKGDYVVANGDAPNGTSTSLISPEFTPTPNSSLTFRYAIIGTSILSVWVTQINNGNSEKREIWTTEGMMNGVQTTNMTSLENNMVQNDASNNSNNMDWLTGCFDIPMADKVSIEIVSRRMDQTGGVVALNWVEINNNPCKIGLDYAPCNFDDPNICGYTIDCPHNVKYKWKRISGSSPVASTGPQTDHTFNTTIGNYLYTKGSVGSPGEKAIVTFMDVQTVENASLRFYYYMSGRDIGSLNIIVGSTSGNVSWARKGEKSPFWSFGCMDLPSNEKTNISFIGIRGNGPLSDIAIDDVQLFNGKCPACQAQEYRCSNGECILGSKRCDYTLDCSDNSDEQNCIYPTTTTKPTTMVPTTMVPTTMVPTTNACTRGQWHCSGSKCISIDKRCDGFNDCANGNDEKNCPTQSTAKPPVTTPGVPQTTIACTQNQWRCSGSKCISIGKRCDGFIDCVNGDDEKNCPTQSTAKPLVTTPGITQTTIACTQNQWRCSGSKCISIDKRCDGFNDCVNGDDEKNCPTQSTAKPLVTTPGVTQTTIACTQNQWRCSGSKCIPINRRCDGFNDCVNGDDEKNCPTQSTAKPLVTTPGVTQTTIACAQNKWRCPEGNCIQKISRCDGFDDCTGGADENNCPAQSQLTALKGTNTKGCTANQFRCDNGDCIPMSKFCNKIQDCRDGSDENCSHSRGSKPRGSVKG